MGLFDGLKGEAQRNFIARSDAAKNDILYAYPERNVRIMTQLTVGADEVAIFVKDGQVQGKLGPGRHTLDTQNIPFLGRFIEASDVAHAVRYLVSEGARNVTGHDIVVDAGWDV